MGTSRMAVRVARQLPFATALAVLGRELRLAYRRPADLLNPVFFLAVTASLFPVAVSPLPEVLRLMGPGVLWIAVLLAAMLPLTTHYGQDLEDGTLEQYVLAGQSLIAICVAKTVALWLVAGVPLVLVSGLAASSYGVPSEALPVLLATLGFGSFALCGIGGIAAALTVGVQRASALVSLLVLPLMVPVLIFGTRAVSLAASGESAAGPVYLVAAVAVLVATLAPWATAVALRISLE